MLNAVDRAQLEGKAAAAIELKRRQTQEYIRYFVPHPEQYAFFKATAKVKAVFAGNRWGKTMALLIDFILLCVNRHPFQYVDNNGILRVRNEIIKAQIPANNTQTDSKQAQNNPIICHNDSPPMPHKPVIDNLSNHPPAPDPADSSTPVSYMGREKEPLPTPLESRDILDSPAEKYFPIDFDVNMDGMAYDYGISRCRLCTVSLKAMEKIHIPLLKRLLVRGELRGGSFDLAFSKYHTTLHFGNGSFIEFMSYEQGVDAFQGTSRHKVGHDEACPDVNIYRENMARLIDVGGQFVVGMTPTEGMTWEFEEIYEKSFAVGSDIAVFSGDMENNPYLPRSEVEAFKRGLSEDERKTRMKGQFVALQGMIYPMFRKEPGVLQVLKDDFLVGTYYPVTIIIDPHEGKETAVGWYTIDRDGRMYVINEYRKVAQVSRVVADIINTCRLCRYRVVDVYIDRAMGRKHNNLGESEQNYLEQFEEWFEYYGFPVDVYEAPNVKDSFWPGVQEMKIALTPDSLFGKPRFFVFPSCIRHIWEFSHYRFKKSQVVDQESYRERVRNVDDDLVTCARYYVMLHPEYNMDSGREVPENRVRRGHDRGRSVPIMARDYPITTNSFFGDYDG